IHLPPLRERGDDILLLAHHFVQKHAAIANKPAPRLSHEAALVLQQYPWPGNVRELEHAIEHAVVLARSDAIVPGSLPSEIAAEAASHPVAPQVAPHAAAPSPGAGDAAAGGSLLEQLGLAGLSYPDAKKAV